MTYFDVTSLMQITVRKVYFAKFLKGANSSFKLADHDLQLLQRQKKIATSRLKVKRLFRRKKHHKMLHFLDKKMQTDTERFLLQSPCIYCTSWSKWIFIYCHNQSRVRHFLLHIFIQIIKKNALWKTLPLIFSEKKLFNPTVILNLLTCPEI